MCFPVIANRRRGIIKWSGQSSKRFYGACSFDNVTLANGERSECKVHDLHYYCSLMGPYGTKNLNNKSFLKLSDKIQR